MITDQASLEFELELLNTTIENALALFESRVAATDELLNFQVGIGQDYILPEEPFWVGIATARVNQPGGAIEAYVTKSIPSDAQMQ